MKLHVNLIRNERGLTLLEVLASIVVLGLLVVGLMQLTSASLLGTVQSEQRHQGRISAETYLNEIKQFLAETYTPLNVPTEAQLKEALSDRFLTIPVGNAVRHAPIVAELGVQPDFSALPANRTAMETLFTCKDNSGNYKPYIIFAVVTWS